MSQATAEAPNAEQIEFWNEIQGDKWVRLQDRTDAMLQPVGHAAIERLSLRPGEQVLDVGCGCGTTTLELAKRVGSGGTVVGADVSRPMLAHARERAGQSGSIASFLEADAQTHDFGEGAYDAVFSRVGVMFFKSPEAAFANLRRAVKPGGRLTFACWRDKTDNPWLVTAMKVAGQYIELPPPPEVGEPGPFSFADEGHVRPIVEGAGWADVAFERHDTKLHLGSDAEDATKFIMQMGPASPLVAEADEKTQAAVFGDLKAAMAPHAGPQGVQMEASIWIVTAKQA
jgi:SAM-dependent methyltransferase